MIYVFGSFEISNEPKVFINFITIYRDNKILQEANEIYIKQEKDNLKSVDPKLALAEQRLEAMFQELVNFCIF